jgi:PAS domain S-box-containing protein
LKEPLPPDLSRLFGQGWASQRIADVDWSATSLGEPRGWPASLRHALGLVLHARFAMFLAWGPERISFHNDAYLPHLGEKPNAIGRPAHQVWSEVWPVVGPIVERAAAGQSSWFDKLELTVERNGRDRRTWRTVSCSPVLDDDGSVGGVLWTVHETTEAVLAERRQIFLIELADALREAASDEAITTAAAALLGRHLGVDRVGYGDVHPGGTVRVQADWTAGGMASLAGETRLPDAFAPDVLGQMRLGRTLVVADCLTDPRTADDRHLEAWAGIGVRAAIVAPLLRDGRLIGLLDAHAAEPRVWAEADVRVMEDVARIASAAIARARAETRLQEALDELRLSHERFNLAQEVGGIGSWQWNILTDEGWVSDTYKQMHGLSEVEGPLRIAQVIGVIHPDDLAGYQARLAAAKQRAEPSTNEYRVVLPDGAIRWVWAKGRPIFGEDGALIGALGIVIDLTERKEAAAAEALRQALEAAERERIRSDEANRAKSKFLAMISHDVRTPLNVVLGLASVLKPKLTDPAHTELVAEIESAGGMLLRLLNGVLDLSKIESGEAAARPAPVELREELLSIAGDWRERVRELVLSLGVAFDGAPEHFRVFADGAKVEQTVINFLSNALKLTPAGRIEIRATARPVRNGIAFRIAVHDEGPGVPPEYRETVFEPFEQLAEGRAAGGAGLGLAICKANVQALGGRLGVDNKPDRGAIFWFEFEAPQVELADAARAAGPGASRRRLKVLAAEDHPSNRRLLMLVLDQLGADVVLAEDGAQAVSAYAEARYDLVLMDAMMPVMDGVCAVAAIRAAEPALGRRTPVFMLTANVFDEDVARYLATGADGVLRKPIELAELAAVLDKVRHGSAPAPA